MKLKTAPAYDKTTSRGKGTDPIRALLAQGKLEDNPVTRSEWKEAA